MATTPSSIEISNPDWVEDAQDNKRVTDPLGLRNPAQAISNQVLQGITTISPNLRYFTFFAWMIWFYDSTSLPKKIADFRDFVARLESAVVIGNMLVNRNFSGLGGVDKAGKIVDEDKPTIKLVKLLKNLQMNAYLGPALQLQLVSREDGPIPKLVVEMGESLAHYFHEQVKDSTFIKQLQKNPLLDETTRTDLLEFGNAAKMDFVSETESNLLSEMILKPIPPNGYNTNGAKRRAMNIRMVMDVCESMGEIPWADNVLMSVSNTESGSIVQDTDVYHLVREGWLAFSIRDMLVFYHEYCLQLVGETVGRMQVGGVGSLLRNVVDELTEIAFARAADISISGLDHKLLNEETRINALMESLDAELKPEQTIHGFHRWSSVLSEIQLLDRKLRSYDEGRLVLLVVAWLLVHYRLNSAGSLAWYNEIRFKDDQDHLSLRNDILPAVDRWRKESFKLKDALQYIIRKTIKQHLRISYERWALDPRADMAVIVIDDQRVTKGKEFVASRTESRIDTLIGWLRQLGYIEGDGLTEAGQGIKQSLDSNFLSGSYGSA